MFRSRNWSPILRAARPNVQYSVASTQYDSTAVVGANGGVDSTMTYSATGFAETFTIPGGEGMPPTVISLKADDYTGNGVVEGLRDAVYKLVAFFVATPKRPPSPPSRAT